MLNGLSPVNPGIEPEAERMDVVKIEGQLVPDAGQVGVRRAASRPHRPGLLLLNLLHM